jgi:hypothetical protein
MLILMSLVYQISRCPCRLDDCDRVEPSKCLEMRFSKAPRRLRRCRSQIIWRSLGLHAQANCGVARESSNFGVTFGETSYHLLNYSVQPSTNFVPIAKLGSPALPLFRIYPNPLLLQSSHHVKLNSQPACSSSSPSDHQNYNSTKLQSHAIVGHQRL